MSGFEGLHPSLQYHIVNSLGWSDLRPTQHDAIGPILDGADTLLLAPTAGGKTEAAAFPLLSRMLAEGWQGLGALYVCPLRALLNNVEPRLARYCTLVGRSARLWHGDVGASARRAMLREPPDLLLTTPESLEGMLISARVDHRVLFTELRAVVVDELHAFGGDDRGWHLLAVLERLERIAGRRLQRIGLSATVGNPEALGTWLAAGRRPVVVGEAAPPAGGEVTLDYVGNLDNAALVLSRLHRGEKRLVFCDSRSRVEALAARLREHGVRTFVSHSSLGREERLRAEAAFAAESDCLIVATSTLELGLDVGDLDRVVQIDAPARVSSFLQRMGRTGRRPGSTRNHLFLATSNEAFLTAAAITGLWSAGQVEDVSPPALPAHLLAQQVMALVLQEGGVERQGWRRWVGATFAGLPQGTAERVLAFMLDSGILFEDGGVLGFAPRGEQLFGRRHFMDLTAAFTAPLLFNVLHGRETIGQVHPLSLTSPDGGPVTLSLGGRGYRLVGVDWPRRAAWVEPTGERGKSRWLGTSPALPFALCREALRVLMMGNICGATPSRRALEHLAELREELAFCEEGATAVVQDSQGRVRWWTFAGLAANAALVAALGAHGSARPENFAIAFNAGDARAIVGRIRCIDPLSPSPPPFVDEDAVERSLKFAECLPPDLAHAILRARMTDLDGARRILEMPVKTVGTK